MTSQKCCICGKQNKKDLNKITKNCEIIGARTATGILCNKHDKKLNEFLNSISFDNNESRVNVRFDKKLAKFFLVVPCSNHSISYKSTSSPSLNNYNSNNDSPKSNFPTMNPKPSSSTSSITCRKSLLEAMAEQLPCTVCGQSNLTVSDQTFRHDIISLVYLKCPHCCFSFEFNESEPHLQVKPKSSKSKTSISSNQINSISNKSYRNNLINNNNNNNNKNIQSSSRSTLVLKDIQNDNNNMENELDENESNENESGGISPQLAASALLSLDQTPPPSNPQSPSSNSYSSHSQDSKKLNLSQDSKKSDLSSNSSTSIENSTVPSSMPSSPVSPSSASSSSSSSSEMKSAETNMASNLTINTAVTQSTSSDSPTTTGVKRLRSDDQDSSLQAARAQAPKKRRLDSFTNIKPIQSEPQKSISSKTRLPSLMQSFPMEPMPSFEDLASTLKSIVPYGLNNAQ